MKRPTDVRLALAFETAVIVLLCGALLLARDTAGFAHPLLLPMSAALLLLTLAAAMGLKRTDGLTAWKIPWLAACMGAASGIVLCSGGAESPLWVLFLLPLYAASLMLPAFWVRSSYAVAAGLLLFLSPDPVTFAFSLVKVGILLAGAELLLSAAEKREELTQQITQGRGELARLAREMILRQRRLASSDQLADLGILSSQLIHDIRTPLAIIEGTVHLIETSHLAETNSVDLNRLRRAVAESNKILSSYSKLRRDAPAIFDHEDLAQIVQDSITAMKRGLDCEISSDIRSESTRIKTDRATLERTFNLCLEAIAGLNAPGSSIRVIVEDAGESKAIEVRLTAKPPDRNNPDEWNPNDDARRALRVADELLVSLGGALRLESGALGLPWIVFSIPRGLEETTGTPADLS